ncbi:50S ribosomal protein L16 [Candidatus Woesearchaeota archaeon]|nr:50S ribosomal protein L16 [Candidatus Woesearchaeota archaeon]
MARIRKFSAYRSIERPYTRISKFKKKSYVKSTPHRTTVKFDMGTRKKKFRYKLDLVSKADLQIRHNAIESARMTCNRILEAQAGKNGYFLRIKIFPHHILRENPLAAGAGADRFSTGMSHSFGKPISSAARVRKNQVLFHLDINKQHLDLAKLALKRAAKKLPCSCLLKVSEAK